MIKTINKTKIKIELEPYGAYGDTFERYILNGLEKGKHGAKFIYKGKLIGSWCIQPTIKKGWEHKYFQMCTDFYIRY